MKQSLLLTVLLAPARAAHLSLLDWDLLVRQARGANLLAELARRLPANLAPPQAQAHLDAAVLLIAHQRQAVLWELRCIRAACDGLPLILLKGAAYLARGLPLAGGRFFTDIDLLVPHMQLAATESAFLIHGWRSAEMGAYDQRYYRQWMHEIPPLTHFQRDTSIDLHHAILPGTARLRVNTPALFEHLQALPGHPGLFTLADADMLLHSATHLFHEGEFTKGLRDLLDLDALLRDFGSRTGFLDELAARAQVLGLQRPLFYALRYCTRWLGTPVPAATLAQAKDFGPNALTLVLMDACWSRALQPVHPSTASLGTSLARAALYLRSHWLRMPPPLLLLHLARKSWRKALRVDQTEAAAKMQA